MSKVIAASAPSRRAQFEARVRAAAATAQNNPGRYRWGVIAWALLGYGTVAVLLALLVGTLGLMLWSVTVSGAVIFFLVKSKLIFLVGGGAWVTVRALWVSVPEPEGLKINRAKVPALVQEIDALRLQLGVKPLSQIILTDNLNAAMVQTPRLGIFGWHKTTLVLGIQLLMTLTPEEARGVIAHELAHYSHSHAAFAGRIYRARIAWQKIADAIEAKTTLGGSVFRKAIAWYMNRFDAYSYPLAQANEYEADRAASAVTGGAMAAALERVTVMDQWLSEAYWRPQLDVKRLSTDAPTKPFHSLEQFLASTSPSGDAVTRILAAARDEKTEVWNTHPAFTDRLRALGVDASTLSGSRPLGTSAARAWLGTAYEDILQWFDERWFKENSDAITRVVARHVGDQARLDALEATKSAGHSMDEALEYAWLCEQLREPDIALEAYRAVLTHDADHFATRYNIGRLLLAAGNAEASLPMLDPLRERLPFAPTACGLLADHYRQSKQLEDAELWQKRAEQQEDRMQTSLEKRQSLTAEDLMVAPSLPPGWLESVASRLADRPYITWLAVAQKVDPDWPDDPLFALAIGISKRAHGAVDIKGIAPSVFKALDELSPSFVVVATGDLEILAVNIRQKGVEIPLVSAKA
jgi:Zn-dependent protease with chaperone function